VTAPLAGVVLTRSTEQGNLVQVGNELLRLGDFSQAKVTVQVSELDLANVRVGGAATVRLDAFPQQQFAGRVRRVSPAANPTSRLVPVELAIPNPTGRVGSGLLARARFVQPTTDRVVVPLSALQEERAKARSSGAVNSPDRGQAEAKTQQTKGKIFVVRQTGEQANVVARSVGLGERLDGKVEIVSGLNPGERFVVRASQPIEDGDAVRLSILSAK
jgi:HlyD family secretion protein